MPPAPGLEQKLESVDSIHGSFRNFAMT